MKVNRKWIMIYIELENRIFYHDMSEKRELRRKKKKKNKKNKKKLERV